MLKSAIILWTCLLSCFWGMGQQEGANLYDFDHSLEFANYLFRTGQYGLAADEFERLNFMQPGDSLVEMRLFKSYRLAGEWTEGLNRYRQIYPLLNNEKPWLQAEFCKIRVQAGEWEGFGKMIRDSLELAGGEQAFLWMNHELMRANWHGADSTFSAFKAIAAEKDARIPIYAPIVTDAQNIRYKKPGLALGMSALLPGSGKVYSKQPVDGLISLIFVGATAWQAVRIFRKKGTDDPIGWVMAGLSFTFYSANLYGSHKAARRYNDRKDEEIRHRTRAAMARTF